jgi:hypothetical protein
VKQVALAAAITAGAVAFGFVGLLVWDSWLVNHDGTFYMALAHNLRHGAGYVFPDGTVATFRGPVYPGLLASGWFVFEETARTAIWMSRVALLLVPSVVTLLLWRWTASWWVAFAAGAIAAVQPWLLISGSQFFVPDGLAAGLALAAILAYTWDPAQLPPPGRVVAAGALFGAAFLVKDPLVLAALAPLGVAAAKGGLRTMVSTAGLMSRGFLVITLPWFLYALTAGGSLPQALGNTDGVAAWSLLVGAVAFAWITPLLGAGGRAMPIWGVTLAVALVSLGALVVATGAPMSELIGLWGSLTADLQTQLYRESAWVVLLVATVATLAWAVYRRDRLPEQMALLVSVVGFAGLLVAVLGGAGLRNAILLPLGLLLLLGLGAAGVTALRPAFAVASVGLLFGVFWVSVQASSATDGRLDYEALTAETWSTWAAADWLAKEAAGEPVIGTSLYTQSLWRLTGGDTPWYLLPNHRMDREDWEGGRRAFTERADWAGTVPAPATGGNAAAYTLNRTTTGAYFAAIIENEIRSSGAAFVVVTGNTLFSQSAFDGGGILPLLEAAEGLSPVYRSHPSTPQWVVIYRVNGPVRLPDRPPLIHATSGELHPPTLAPDQVVLTSPEHEVMVKEILARPIPD